MRLFLWHRTGLGCFVLSCTLAISYGQQSAPKQNSDKKVSRPDGAPTPLGGNATSTVPSGKSAARQGADAELGQMLDQAASQYRSLPEAELQQAKAGLIAALATLDAYLHSSPTEGPAWKRYLKWDELQAQLVPAAMSDRAVLRDVLRLYRDKYPGLELPWFTNVRYWLKTYTDRLEAAAHLGEKAYKEQLNVVRQALNVAAQAKQPDSKQLGRAIAWLQHAGQAPELVAALRRRFSRANALVHVTSRLVTSGIDRPVDETQPIQDNINGTAVSGTGRTIGQVTGALLPDPQRGAIATTLTGVTASSTVGYHGPAIIYATAQTSIWGQKLLYFDANGLHTDAAAANAVSKSHVYGVGANHGGLIGRIVQKGAWKRIPEQKPRSDRISSQHASMKVARQLDRQAGVLIERANANYAAKLRDPLVRQEAFPRRLDVSSDPGAMRIVATESNDELLGAPGDPPQLDETGELYLQLHESFINNLANDMLGGRTLTREDVETGATDTFGSLPPSMKQDRDEDATPWAIEFAAEDPVAVAFDNNEASITVRGHHYKQGSRVFPAMTVSAKYKLVGTPQGMRADREGELTIYPPALGPGRQMGVREKVVEKMLRKRFNRIFEPQIVFHGLKLPGNWAKLGPLHAHHFKSQTGWLLMAWDADQPTSAHAMSGAIGREPIAR